MKEKIGTSGRRVGNCHQASDSQRVKHISGWRNKRDWSDERVVLQINLETSSTETDWSRWAGGSSKYGKRLKRLQLALYILLVLDRALCKADLVLVWLSTHRLLYYVVDLV